MKYPCDLFSMAMMISVFCVTTHAMCICKMDIFVIQGRNEHVPGVVVSRRGAMIRTPLVRTSLRSVPSISIYVT